MGRSCGKFIPLQFGVTAFTVDPGSGRYWIVLLRIMACPFNFHTFPLSLGS